MVDVVSQPYTIPLPLEKVPKADWAKYELEYRIRIAIKWRQIATLLDSECASDTMEIMGAPEYWTIHEVGGLHGMNHEPDTYYVIFTCDHPFEGRHIGHFLRGLAEMERSYDLLEFRRTGTQ